MNMFVSISLRNVTKIWYVPDFISVAAVSGRNVICASGKHGWIKNQSAVGHPFLLAYGYLKLLP